MTSFGGQARWEKMTSPGVNFTKNYEQIFCTKVFCAAFMCSQFGFVIFWQKDFGAKAANKMLVKLTPGGKLTAQACHLGPMLLSFFCP
jgi:hypothetical protein